LSEVFQLHVSSHFSVDSIQIGELADRSCLMTGKCKVLTSSSQVITRNMSKNIVVAITGSNFEASTHYTCVIESENRSQVSSECY
jgi:diphthamide biosynthesis methyltransferase